MIYTKPEILRRAAYVIDGAKHADHERTVEYAAKCRAYTTGDPDGMEPYLIQFTSRETTEQFEQRKRLTVHTTKSAISKWTSPFDKVPRAKYRKTLEYTTANEKNLEELQEILDNFNGRDVNVETYLAERLKDLNNIDPNTFLVIEFGEFAKTERAKSYPFEVPSKSAVDYRYENGVLQYLIAHLEISTDEVNPDAEKVNRYTVYLPDQTITIQETTKEEQDEMFRSTGFVPAAAMKDKGYSIEVQEAPEINPYWLRVGAKYYRVTEAIPHDAGRVPAVKAGFRRGKGDMAGMMVSLFDDAMPHLDEMVGTKSQLDLVQALSAFPFVIRVGEPCGAKGCLNGYDENGKECGICHGSGKKQRPMSAQDELAITVESGDLKELPDLKNLYVFISPPVEFLQYMDKRQADLEEKGETTMYKAGGYTKARFDATATKTLIDQDDKTDTVWPFALHFAETWVFVVTTAAAFADLDPKDNPLVVAMRFDQDLRMRTRGDLLNERQIALAAGAPPAIISYLDTSIMERMTADDPKAFERYRVQQQFDPFAGKSETEKAFSLSSEFVTMETKVLSENLGNIFDKLELQFASMNPAKNFYEAKRTEQLAAIQAEVKRIIQEIKQANPMPDLMRPLPGVRMNGNGVEREEAA